MAQPLISVVTRLAADAAMARAFAAAFPETPQVNALNLAKALATYERTFVSPSTRFDRWIAGDPQALTAGEVAGFRLFTGKAGCVKCHSGFAFTDYAFHDIGLPSEDRGRGAVLRLAVAEHAFKTPGLREIGRSAPYMHDGSLATLADVIRHYERGVVERPTLSKDLTRKLRLTQAERADLIAFLGTLTSESDPGVAQHDRAGQRWADDAGGAGEHGVAGRQEFSSRPHRASARRAIVDRQQRHPNAQCAGVRSGARFRFRRPGAGRDRRDRVPESRLVPGVLRHPSEDGALCRRGALNDDAATRMSRLLPLAPVRFGGLSRRELYAGDAYSMASMALQSPQNRPARGTPRSFGADHTEEYP